MGSLVYAPQTSNSANRSGPPLLCQHPATVAATPPLPAEFRRIFVPLLEPGATVDVVVECAAGDAAVDVHFGGRVPSSAMSAPMDRASDYGTDAPRPASVFAWATLGLPVLLLAYAVAGLGWEPLMVGGDHETDSECLGSGEMAPAGWVILLSAVAVLVLVVSGLVMTFAPNGRDRSSGKVLLAAGLLLVPALVAVSAAFGSMGAPQYCD
jgi:hypothetical protein